MNYKSLAVAQSILDTCSEKGIDFVSPMKLLKLIYICHGYMLGKHSLPLLDEPVLAYQYGPIVDSVYQEVRHYKSSHIDKIENSKNYKKDLLNEEKEVISQVVSMYGKFDAIKLSIAMLQSHTPWFIARAVNDENTVISNDYISFFYKNILSSKTHSKL